MTHDSKNKLLLRIGILIGDPLRVEGLQVLLAHMAELVPMTAPDTLKHERLSMVILDGEGDRLFSMIAAFRRARPGLRLLVLGSRPDPAYIQKVVAAGVKGYLTQSASVAEIETAISVVSDGSIWAPRKVLASLIDTYSPHDLQRPKLSLTVRERQVLRILISGRSNLEIAEQLNIESKTVKVYVGRLLQKLGVPNRVALTVRAIEMPELLAGDDKAQQ